MIHKNIILYTDAGTINNGKIGKQKTTIIVCSESGKTLFRKDIGDYTVNEGEILAMIAVLKNLYFGKSVKIFSDSRIATNWIMKGWGKYHEKRLRKGKLTNRHKKFITFGNKLLTDSNSLVEWIPRDKNKAGWILEKDHI